MKNYLFLLMLVILIGCGVFVSDDSIKVAVGKQGYRNVEIVSKHIIFVNWQGCGKDDEAAFEIKATNSFGAQVDLIACAGWPFKGVTVRTK